jgi:hypothetical protein
VPYTVDFQLSPQVMWQIHSDSSTLTVSSTHPLIIVPYTVQQ